MRVFISKQLKPDSEFVRFLKSRGHDVHAESLITFSPVQFDRFPETDWLFFYSKPGVRFFLQQVGDEKLVNKKIAAIGTGTAEYLEKIYRAPDFSGDADPLITAAAFLAEARGRSVLFLRAKENRQSIQQLLGDKIFQEELVVYENKPRTDFELPFFEVLVFTSPLNAETYFSKYPPLKNQRIIAIGDTTREKLTELGLKNVELTDAASDESIAKVVVRHL
jgi:uroporphyrinogen-III synthase